MSTMGSPLQLSNMIKRRFVYFVLLLLGVFAAFWFGRHQLGVNPPLPKALTSTDRQVLTYLRAPAGFEIVLFADDLKAPRMLKKVDAGLLVSLPHEGRVLLLRDDDQDGVAEQRISLVDGLKQPHGIDSKGGWLYIAETDAVGRIAFDPRQGATHGEYTRLVTGLPHGKGHWTRTLKIGPDGWLYVTVGSSCNACIETEPERAAMFRMRLDGSDKQLYATGLRNSVDFDWSPADGGLYATDNSRDWLGDDFPPDELNKIVKNGFYGWPYANADKIPDPDFGEGRQALIAQSRAPSFEFRAHNAPLGIRFLRYQDNAAYQHSALVALHGSWNRSSKDGYKVVSLHWDANGAIRAKDFMTGFLQGEQVQGRPVGIEEGADGDIYISDDYAGLIYRLTGRNQ